MKIYLLSLILITQTVACSNQKISRHPLTENYAVTSDSTLNIKAWRKLHEASDEFNNSYLDTLKWKRGLWYAVSGDFAFKNENSFVTGGNLLLTAKKERFNDKEYTIGALESKFDVPAAPSLVRVRAKLLPDSANVCSAIWLQTWPEVKTNPNPEIDIIEYFQQSEMHMNMFTWNKDDSGNYKHVDFNGQVFNYKKDISLDYHIFGLERINDRIRYYFDDQLVCDWKAPDTAFSTMPRHVILSLEGHRYVPNAARLPASFKIDWVRVYKAAGK